MESEPQRRRSTDRFQLRLTIIALACWAVIATAGMASLWVAQQRNDRALKTAVQAKQLADAIRQDRIQGCRDQNTRHRQTDAYVRSVFAAVIKSAATPAQRTALQTEETEYEQLVQDLAPLNNDCRAINSQSTG